MAQSPRDHALLYICKAKLAPATFRAAVILLVAAHDETGYLRIAVSDCGALLGCGEGQVRRLLGFLRAADVIHYSVNGEAHIMFRAWSTTAPEPGLPSAHPKNARGRAENARGRADSAHDELTIEPTDDTPRAENARGRAENARGRAENARDLTRVSVSLLVSQSDLDPDPELTNELSPEPEPNNHQPGAVEVDQSLVLLTDPDVGLDLATARTFAAAHRFSWLLSQVMTWRRQLESGKVTGAGALISRIRGGFGCSVTKEDKRSALYRRHVAGDQDSEARRRERYIPDEYSDIIIG